MEESASRQSQLPELDLSRLDETGNLNMSAAAAAVEDSPRENGKLRLADSPRNNSGTVKGYLMKSAQNLSTFQRKQFYRRYYELDIESKQLKIFEKEGGMMKEQRDAMPQYVVSNLRGQLRYDYKSFFTKDGYSDIYIEHPKEYTHPFALFFPDGQLMVLWAASRSDFTQWTKAFKALLTWQTPDSYEFVMSPKGADLPIPELTNDNYFVAALYLCLLPEQYL